ncbi:MAG: glycosyltransferase family 2 protein [Patescibacteria group bacterium]
MMKLFSFVIPTHNSEITIPRLLLSINRSSSKYYKSIEVIIIDDNSKDKTITVVKNIIKKLKFKTNIYSFKKHIGPARARNMGAKYASGKYLVFLDGDVELKKNTLKNIYSLLLKEKIKAFTGIWDYHQKTESFFPQFKAIRDWSYWFVEREEYSHYYLFSTRIAGIEKKLFQKLRGFIEDYKEPTVEDIELTYRIEKLSSIKFCSNIVVNHEFEEFFPIAIKYFKRSRDWIKLYLKRFRFDPVATSKREAFKSILSSVLIFLLFMSIFFNILLVPAFLLFLIYSYLEFKFWKFILQKKGFVFFLKSIPTSIILYQFINFGAAWGYITAKKIKIRN